MIVRPIRLKDANEMVEKYHRHHKPVQGYRFAIGAYKDDVIVGAAIVGRPVSRCIDPCAVAEITRLVTDGTKNACSFLYSACARIAREMGFEKIQTYILDSESGKSLKASGWIFEEMTTGGNWNHSKQYGGKRRTDQPMSPKQRWSRSL